MKFVSHCELDDATIVHLQQLIQANLDFQADFKEAATFVADPSLACLMAELAAQHEHFATVLQDYVELNGKVPKTQGTLLAAWYRSLRELCASSNCKKNKEIVLPIQKSATSIERSYEEALSDILRRHTRDHPVGHCLRQQYDQIRAGREQLLRLQSQLLT
jgi:uncharacterized protein (TIGR02284 family)